MRALINGINLAYDDAGSGPAVLLIHGYPLCRRMWEPQKKALVAAGYRVIVPDLRGFGESEAPQGPASMELYAADLVALLDHLGIGRAAAFGMSMGGYVLLSLLDRHADRIAAAGFVVTRAGADDEAGKSRRSALAREAEARGGDVVAEAFEGVLFAPDTVRRRPELVEEVRGWMTATSPRGLAAGLLAMRDRPDYTGRLGEFGLPALVVGADQDRAIPPEQSRILEAGLPNATFTLIAGAGHMANLERPEAFNLALLGFLAGLPG